MSNRPPRQLSCSKLPGVHGEVLSSSVPHLNDHSNHSATSLPPTASWPGLWLNKGGKKSLSLLKWCIRNHNLHRSSILLTHCMIECCCFKQMAPIWLYALIARTVVRIPACAVFRNGVGRLWYSPLINVLTWKQGLWVRPIQFIRNRIW